MNRSVIAILIFSYIIFVSAQTSDPCRGKLCKINTHCFPTGFYSYRCIPNSCVPTSRITYCRYNARWILNSNGCPIRYICSDPCDNLCRTNQKCVRYTNTQCRVTESPCPRYLAKCI